VEDLKKRVVRGGVSKLLGQVAIFVLRLGFVAIMARLLQPEDFGLVAMVIAFTGLYDLFTTAGLSLAAVQRPTITNEQVSTLFWVNILVGALLCVLCFVTAPFLVTFYNEPRLFWVTAVLGAGFVFNAVGVQHSALLQRQLRFTELTIIEVFSLLVSYALGIGLAVCGFGYWALVASMITTPAISSVLMWAFTNWIPGLPRGHADIRSLLSFGGTITLNNLIVYVAYNTDKLLVGRFWGAGALGIYGTAYQLVNVPTRNLTATLGGIAFSALSRLQDEPMRLKSYFLKGYFLLISITAPITIFSAVFADDIVLIFLGPTWAEAAPVFRLLTPTILVFSIINPTGILLQSIGLQVRSLLIALVIAPLAVAGYLLGLPYGPTGVASGFSAAMTLWLVPHVFWCLHNTAISVGDFFATTYRPFLASILAAALAWAIAQLVPVQVLPPFARLVIVGSTMVGTYVSILMFAMGQKALYLNLLRGLKSSPRSQSAAE
jgi:O-antigen/teichoic acid export membrane protein